MPTQAVILFLFAVVACFGSIWGSNLLRQRFSASFLENFFLFTLVAVFFGFVNWVLPYITLFIAGADNIREAEWAIAVSVLISVPLVLAKLYLLFSLFQALLNRPTPAWLNYLWLAASTLVLLLTVISIKSFYDGEDLLNLRSFITDLGVLAVVTIFAVLIHCLFAGRSQRGKTAEPVARPLAWLYLAGYSVYVIAAYSAYLPVNQLIESLTPYFYFITHALPIPLIWYLLQSQPAPVLDANTPSVNRLVEQSELTPREAVVLRQIIVGSSNQEIADRLSISPHTVRNHIYSIYRKTGIRNRFQLLAHCQEESRDLVN